MEEKELRKLLVELHDEIEKTGAVDEKGGELLRDLREDIADLLERSGEEIGEVRQTSLLNMQDTLDHFEVTHPNLTLLISKTLEALSNSGI